MHSLGKRETPLKLGSACSNQAPTAKIPPVLNTGVKNKKETQLGMPIGTASGRLKKTLMFSMAQRLNETRCFRCEQEILTVDEFTIDHKVDWLDSSADLFWDLNNIAFSHSECNIPGTRRNGSVERRKVGPVGSTWCAGHQQFLPVDLFRSYATSWSGLYYYCKECESNKRRAYRGRMKPHGSSD